MDPNPSVNEYRDPRIPICRCLLICMDGRTAKPGEQTIIVGADGNSVELLDSGGDRILLQNPVVALAPKPGRGYPAVIDQLFVYSQLSGGSGVLEVSIDVHRWRFGESYRLFRTPSTPIDFGIDRAAVMTYSVRLKPIIFPHSGQYSFRLVRSEVVIGETHLKMLEAP